MRNLIAILRGIRRDEIDSIVTVLLEAGITKIEVPLNSPDPFDTIAQMVRRFADQALLGAGTVLSVTEVLRLADIGAKMVVSPHCDLDVIKATKAANMLSYPGVMTPSECFAALKAGADGIKLFPGEVIGVTGLKAMRAVLPSSTICLAVGGVKPENFAQWKAAGIDGFGIGSAIYQANDHPDQVAQKARNIVRIYDEVMT